MTLASEAARAEQAEQRHAAEVQSAEAYRARALAVQQAEQATERSRAEADRQSRLPVIIDAVPQKAEPAPTVTVQRPAEQQADRETPAQAQTVVPLPEPAVAAFLSEHRRYDADGVAKLQQEWGSDLPANLGYARSWLSRHLSAEQQERIRAEGFDILPLFRLIAGFGREEAHSRPTTTMKGNPMPGEQMTKAAAEKKFNDLTRQIHDALARGDRIAVQELDAERHLLSEALHPGDTAPDANHRQVIG